MLQPGAVVDRYEVLSLLGKGGMGQVYRARDTRLDREVALKIVSVAKADDVEDARRRLLREARAASAIDHIGAVAIFDVGEFEEMPYIVMELVPGNTLRVAMSEPQRTRSEKLRWLLDVAEVLKAAHQRNLVHRDIKPENIMLRPDGVIRVLDFGIARRPRQAVDASAPTEDSVFATLTQTGIPVGTPLYMAPEQIRGMPVDHRTDQFAWGVMAYELIAGRAPWQSGDSLQLVASILTDEPTRLDSITTDLVDVAAIVHRTLAKLPENRFTTTDELVAALSAALSTGTSAPSPATPQAPAPLMPAPRSVDFSQFNAPELCEIFERALLRQPATEAGLDAGAILELAGGLNIPAATLDEAAELFSRVKSPKQRQEANLRAWKIHLWIWAACGLFFFLINMLANPGTIWFLYPIVSWGVAVAIHAISIRFAGQPQPRANNFRRIVGKLEGQRIRTGLVLEPAVRELLRGASPSPPPATTPSFAPAVPSMSPRMSMSPQISWDARFAARRIDSRVGQGNPSEDDRPDSSLRDAPPLREQAAEAEAEAEAEELERKEQQILKIGR